MDGCDIDQEIPPHRESSFYMRKRIDIRGMMDSKRRNSVEKAVGRPRARGVKKAVDVPETLELRAEGFSWAQIAELYDVSKPTLRARVREAEEAESGSPQRRWSGAASQVYGPSRGASPGAPPAGGP